MARVRTLDLQILQNTFSRGQAVTYSWQEHTSQPRIQAAASNKRSTARQTVNLPARLAWKDSRGISRFASVVTRDISEHGVFVECQNPLSLPLYRLVQFQLEPTVRDTREVPESLRHGRILSAVYRVSHATRASRHGVALRLMVDPRRGQTATEEPARATA